MLDVRRVRAFLFSLIIVLSLFPSKGMADEPRTDKQRIEALEARIEKLERTVRLLAQPTAISAAEPSVQPILETASWNLPPSSAGQSAVSRPKFEAPPELVPEIGKIGAEVGLFLGGSANPFKLNRGEFGGGFIDLPLFEESSRLHGKLSYEISVGLSQSNTKLSTTSNVAQVANLSVLNTLFPAGGVSNLLQAMSGSGAAPFPVTTSTEARLRLLQVVPFAMKYTPTLFDRVRIRPYAVAGFGTYVTIHAENAARGKPATYGVRPDADLPPAVLAAVGQIFGGTSPFGAPLVAGQIGQAPELVARGLPGGNGNIDFGLHTGGGIAIRVTRDLSFGIDVRYNRLAGSNGSFTTYGSRVSLHF